jgi:hypothetical protein
MNADKNSYEKMFLKQNHSEPKKVNSSNSSLVIFWILPGGIFRACMALLAFWTCLQYMKIGAVYPKVLWKLSTRLIPASETMVSAAPYLRFISDIILVFLPSHFKIHPNYFIQYSAISVSVKRTN